MDFLQVLRHMPQNSASHQPKHLYMSTLLQHKPDYLVHAIPLIYTMDHTCFKEILFLRVNAKRLISTYVARYYIASESNSRRQAYMQQFNVMYLWLHLAPKSYSYVL